MLVFSICKHIVFFACSFHISFRSGRSSESGKADQAVPIWAESREIIVNAKSRQWHPALAVSVCGRWNVRSPKRVLFEIDENRAFRPRFFSLFLEKPHFP